MKTIRSLTTLAGLALMVFALGATGAKAQNISFSSFDGTFQLPFQAQWGRMTLPAGDYTLSYGQAFTGGAYAVEVAGKTDGIIRGTVFVNANDDPSSKKDALVCVREGDTLVVRALEIPELNTALLFALPHGEKLMAQNHSRKGYMQLAEAPMLIERIPVTMNKK